MSQTNQMQLIKNTTLNCELSYIQSDEDIWFSGKSVAKALGYCDTDKSIRNHVDDLDKIELKALDESAKTAGCSKGGKSPLYINESGLYSLILRSKLKTAKVFQR